MQRSHPLFRNSVIRALSPRTSVFNVTTTRVPTVPASWRPPRQKKIRHRPLVQPFGPLSPLPFQRNLYSSLLFLFPLCISLDFYRAPVILLPRNGPRGPPLLARPRHGGSNFVPGWSTFTATLREFLAGNIAQIRTGPARTRTNGTAKRDS